MASRRGEDNFKVLARVYQKSYPGPGTRLKLAWTMGHPRARLGPNIITELPQSEHMIKYDSQRNTESEPESEAIPAVISSESSLEVHFRGHCI